MNQPVYRPYQPQQYWQPYPPQQPYYPPPQYQQQPYPMPPRSSVSVQKRRTAWGFHIVMTVCTGGLWLFVWVPYAIFKAMTPKKRTVTDYR